MQNTTQRMDRQTALALLELQLAWGADECLDEMPSTGLSAATSLATGVLADAAMATPLDSVDAIYAAYAAPATSDLWRTATNLVRIEGDPAPGLLLLADTPSAADDVAGRPFTDEDGAWLDRMLAAIRLARAHLLAGFLVPWRPPGDRPPNAADLAVAKALLADLLGHWRPAICVTMGPAATRALLGGAPRRDRAPAWHEASIAGFTLRCLPLPALSAVRAQPAARKNAWVGLRLLASAKNDQVAPG